MKVRKESRGLHFYDRITGLHILADEVRIPGEDRDLGPEVISIALTNVCDLSCAFCYAPKSRHMLSVPEIIHWCRELDQLGTLGAAGGGYRQIVAHACIIGRSLGKPTGVRKNLRNSACVFTGRGRLPAYQTNGV